MICPYCGSENAEGTVFCASCGFEMTRISEQISEHAEKIAKTASPHAQTNQAEESPAFERKKPIRRRSRRRHKHNKLLFFAALGLVCLVIGISIVSSFLAGSSAYHAYKHNILVEIDNGKVAIVQDAKKAKITELEASGIAHHQASLDGSVVAILTDQGVLAVVQRSKLTVVAENVNSFVLSVDGTGLGYVTKSKEETNYTLKLYNVKTKKARDVTYQQSNISFDLAPDGDSLAYYAKKDGQEASSLVFFDGSKNIPITDGSLTLMGLSNDGKCIYTVARDDNGDKVLYSYGQNGEKKLIGPCNIKIAYLNEDHTQILYFNSTNSDGENAYETCISTNGVSGNKIISASSVASPLIPKNCTNFTNGTTVTVPIEDLYNKVYSFWGENGSDIWMVCENSQDSVKLVSNTQNVTLSKNGEYVFYMTDGTLKVLKVSHGEQASQKAILLGEDVVEYVVTSGRKHVYYRTNDGIYCVNGKTGKGKNTVTTDDVADRLYINAKNVVYFMADNDVYASRNGKKAKIVVTDARSLYGSANGIVYVFMNDDSFYATDGATKPRLVWSED